jgi:hypothetical protein
MMGKMKRATALAALLLACCAFAFTACRPPKYLRYTSEAHDFTAEVPYGWQVFFDKSGADYVNYTFVGPFDPDFFRGAPSFSIRWYAKDAARPLPMSQEEESYSSADDYIERTLREIYGEDSYMEQPLHKVEISGGEAQHFIVSAPMPVGKDARYGISKDVQGSLAVLRYHEYAVLPMDNGFYVLIYPATKDGYPKFKDQYLHLVNTFQTLLDGPGGAAIR